MTFRKLKELYQEYIKAYNNKEPYHIVDKKYEEFMEAHKIYKTQILCKIERRLFK